MKKILFILLLLASILNAQSERMYIGGRNLHLGMGKEEVIGKYKNSNCTISLFSPNDSTTYTIRDDYNNYIGDIAFDVKNKLSWMQKIWWLKSPDNEVNIFTSLYYAFKSIEEYYNHVFYEIKLDEMNEPNSKVKKIRLHSMEDSRVIQITVFDSNIQISEYIGDIKK